jgi:hypothetical protein
MRTLLLSLLLAGLAFGQVSPQVADEMQFFHATHEVSLSGSGTTFTLQLPAKAGKRVYPQAAVIECSVDCTVTQDRNGSAATGTAVTALGLNNSGTAAATFYRASNANAGTALVPVTVKAGVQAVVDMTYTVFSRGVDTAQNHNWRVSAITGNARVSVIWGEK